MDDICHGGGGCTCNGPGEAGLWGAPKAIGAMAGMTWFNAGTRIGCGGACDIVDAACSRCGSRMVDAWSSQQPGAGVGRPGAERPTQPLAENPRYLAGRGLFMMREAGRQAGAVSRTRFDPLRPRADGPPQAMAGQTYLLNSRHLFLEPPQALPGQVNRLKKPLGPKGAMAGMPVAFLGDEPFYDAHSHHVAQDRADWATDEKRTSFDQLNALEGARAFGVDQMVISALTLTLNEEISEEEKEGKLIDRTETANDTVEFVCGHDPDFFKGLVQILPDELFGDAKSRHKDNWAADYVADMLDADPELWRGIGELILHGHGLDIEDEADLLKLLDIFAVAVEFDVPVVLHWNLGGVDLNSSMYYWENWYQLVWLLYMHYYGVQSADPPLKLVICHCGLGPTAWPSDTSHFERYWSYVDMLLDPANEEALNYKVWFDLAGMQHGKVDDDGFALVQLFDQFSGDLTDFGAELLDRIVAAPDRFMLGLDQYDNNIPFASVYHASAALYLTYLGSTSASGQVLDATKKEQVRWSNAAGLFGS